MTEKCDEKKRPQQILLYVIVIAAIVAGVWIATTILGRQNQQVGSEQIYNAEHASEK